MAAIAKHNIPPTFEPMKDTPGDKHDAKNAISPTIKVSSGSRLNFSAYLSF